MRRSITACLLVGILFGPLVTIVRAGVTAEQVRQAIDRGVAYLKQQQRPTGTPWPDFLGFEGGVSGLCTLALLNCGVDPDDGHVARALKYLRAERFDKTYCVALQTMALCKSGTDLDKIKINENVQWLQAKQVKEGPHKGGWSYPGRGGDNSNSQFALLALHEAERAGVNVSGSTWRLAKAYWEKRKNGDGSWGYLEGLTGTGSMTCAGIASLIITSDKVRQSNAKAEGDNIRCCLKSDADNLDVAHGLEWLGKNFSVTTNPGTRSQTWLLYYLYGVERVGRLTSQRLIGGRDWYREGADSLVRNQDPLSGFFTGTGHAENNKLIGTSLALLFLSKGRRPVLMAKLKHPPREDWNQHRSDVHNLTRYVESRWEWDLTWQVIDVHAAKVEDLLQAPVIYFCGEENPYTGTDEQKRRLAQKLRDYLDRGGFLFAEAYGGGAAFDQGFRDLMKQVFPEPEYGLRPLDKEHPIWHAEELVEPEYQRPLLGIEFGCRTSVVYAPPEPPRPSLSCLWELSRSGRQQQFTPSVRARVKAGLAIGINVLAYATNRELAGKEAGFDVEVERQRKEAVQRGYVYVAKLRHPGGCDAAPRALINLVETAGRQLKTRTAARRRLVEMTDEALFDYHLVFMHGRNKFRLTEGEKEQLKTYVQRGGMLFADAICASPAFADSFRREIADAFGEKLEPIPVDDPLLTSTYGGFDLKTVTRRDPQARSGTGPLKATLRKVPPELEGIKLGDRWVVIFSRFDISCALEKHDSLECRGYTRQDAARIGLNVVLYSLQQ